MATRHHVVWGAALGLMAGCAPAPLSPAGARIELLAVAGPRCSLVTPLRGSAGYNGHSGDLNAKDVEVYLRNQAAERGADAMVITSRRAGTSWDGDTLSQPRGATTSGGCPNCVTITADAYRCAAPPPVAAAPPKPAPAPVTAGDPPFAERAAEAAVGAAIVSARSCIKPADASGEAHVKVTFATTGDVVYAEVDGGPFAGTPTGECVARKFRNARLPAFAGEARTLSVTLRLGE